MKHYREEDLVLYHYGESDSPDAIAHHLAACERCGREYSQLERVLSAADSLSVPQRHAGYAAEVWTRLEPRLGRRPLWGASEWFRLPSLALAGAAVASLVLAFLIGRWSGGPAPQPIPVEVRERVLLIAVSEHLERSQRLLVELVNVDGTTGIDVTAQQSSARDLAADNRLYRQTASRAGRDEIVDLLEELERVLQEVANGPSRLAFTELAGLQRRIESRGLLIRIRTIEEQARSDSGPRAPRDSSHRDAGLEL
jgi:anti-sigma factor RsiW